MSGRYDGPGRDGRPYVGNASEQIADFPRHRWGSRAEEDTAVRTAERNLQALVRPIELRLIDQSEERRKQAAGFATALNTCASNLNAICEDLDNGVEVDLEQWARLDAEVTRLRALAEQMPAQLDRLDERLDDVVGYTSELQSRFPSLYRPNLLANPDL